MSIANEITALQNNLAAAKNAVDAKGGSTGNTGLAGLASEIASIPSGGGGTIDPTDFCTYVNDNTVYMRIYYYPNTVDSPALDANNIYNCAPTIEDQAKFLQYLQNHANPDPMMGETTLMFNYGNQFGGAAGWYYYDENQGNYVLVGTTDSDIETATGVNPHKTSGAYDAYFVGKIKSQPLADEVLSHDITDYNDFMTFLNWQMPGEESFNSGTFTISNLQIIELRFGSNIDYLLNNNGGWPVTDSYGKKGFEIHLNNFDNLRAIPAFPLEMTFIPGNGFGGSTTSNFNSPIAFPGIAWDTYDQQWDGGIFFRDLPKFNANIYLPSYVGNSTQPPFLGDNMPNMCSEVYWGAGVEYIYSYAFATLSSSAPAYTKGVIFTGPGAAAAKALLPDLNGPTWYRKILLKSGS